MGRMLRRSARLGLAAVILNAALVASALTAPRLVFGCSCAPTDLRDYVGDPGYVIVSGGVTGIRPNNASGQQATFFVDHVFQGILPGPQLQILGGGGGDCSIQLTEGMQFIGVATVVDQQFLSPFLCSPFGDLRDADGQALLAELRVIFPGDPPEPLGVQDVLSLIPVTVAGFGLGLGTLLGVVVLARRIRSS